MQSLISVFQDDYRLPEGMKRVGYDADTGKYYFRDRDGSLWEGPEGAQYGEMRKGVSAKIYHSTNHLARWFADPFELC